MRQRLAFLFVLVGLGLAGAQRTPEELAGQLQDAARRGDGAAYSALVGGRGTFVVEGRNFAADLARVPQPTVQYLLEGVNVVGDEATARLTFSWERRPDAVVRASLPVRLERRGDVWRYAGEDVRVAAVGAFTLATVNEAGLPERAAFLGPLLGVAAGRVRAALGVEVPAGATVKVYPSMVALSVSVNLTLQPVAGWNEPGEAVKLVLPDGPEARRSALRLLSHEFTHLGVTAALPPGTDRRVPWWLHEGLADWASSPYLGAAGLAARQGAVGALARDGWVPLAELGDFNAVPESRWAAVYAQGLGVVEFLAGRAPGQPMALARAFADSGDLNVAARRVGFTSFVALEAGARAWLAAR